MSDYIVSARKYRPMSWQQVVGQDSLTTTLKNAIRSGRLAHAYLFCGPRGVGKTTLARIFARTINCLNPTDDFEACGQCESCVAFNEGRSFNIHELDAASNNSVDDIRQLTDQVQIPPQVGRYKVFIIDEVHMLSTAAFNAFLKTLEEPPAHVIFILATTEKHKILTTILSRCQTFDFNRMTVADTVRHLMMVAEKEGYTAEQEALSVIAQKADGGMRDALSIFDQVAGYTQGNITYQKVIENLNVLDYDYYFKMVDLLLDKKISDSMMLLDEVLSKGFDAGHFISGLASHLRNVMMGRDQQTLPLLQCSEQVRERYRRQAERCQERFIYRALKLCNNCDINYRASRNKRLLVEITLVQVSGADEDPAGRRPAKTLPYIFERLEPRAPEAQPQLAKQTQHDVQQQPAATPAACPSANDNKVQAQERSNGLKRISSLSIKGLGSKTVSQHNPAQQTQQTYPTAAKPLGAARALDEQSLRQWWNSFALALPQDDTALQKRMLGMDPVLIDANSFELLVANTMAESDMLANSGRIESYISQNLGGTAVKMKVRVDESTVMETLSRPQMLNEMAEQNPAINKMRELFGLELN